jgi:exodeoxyribonuclease VII small subunit
MVSERRTRRGSSQSPLESGSDAASDAIVLNSLADYDTAINEIDAIIAQLEEGQHSLDEEMRLYERAMRLAHACDHVLQSAELRVEKLRADLSADTTSFMLEDFGLDEE